MYKKGKEGIAMIKDIEGLKEAGRLFILMGLRMKALAARQSENSSEMDSQAELNDRNDIEIRNTFETEPFYNKKL